MIYQHKRTELFSITRHYTLTFEDGKENEIEVAVETNYQTNPDFTEITEINFLTENVKEKTKELIEEWINDNEDDWKNE